MKTHCAHCPLSAGRPCPGESARRLCDLVDPAHPDHRPGYREAIVDTAGQLGVAAYPPAWRQALSLARSLWRWARDRFRLATRAEQARRRALCTACPEWDAAAARCRMCGCKTEAKIRMRGERCPLDPPRW